MYLLLRSFDTFKSINGSNEWRKFKELKFDPFSRISKIKNSKLLRKKILEKFRKSKRNLTKTKICYALLFLKFSRRFENYSLKKKKGRKNFQRFVRSSKRQGANTFLQLSKHKNNTLRITTSFESNIKLDPTSPPFFGVLLTPRDARQPTETRRIHRVKLKRNRIHGNARPFVPQNRFWLRLIPREGEGAGHDYLSASARRVAR